MKWVQLLSGDYIRGDRTPSFKGQTMGDPVTQKLADGLLQNHMHMYNLTQALLRT